MLQERERGHIMKTLDTIVLSRRQAVALGLGGIATAGLAACGGSASSSSASADAASASSSSAASDASSAAPIADEQEAPAVDAAAYDALIVAGTVADDAVITANAWAKKIKDAGKLRIGGVKTSTFFSLENLDDGVIRGFDAGIYQLLTRYILGDEKKNEVTQVTSDTRESVLTNGQVDAVFATYSITDERKKLIDFAGPYYTSQQSILVKKDNNDITALVDLDGKNVAVQSGSTGPTIMEQMLPEAVLFEFTTDEEARTALEQGRVDAYVIDNTMQMGAVARNPSKYKIVGEPFGPVDPYGIGLSKDSEGAVEFINQFLTELEAAGTWASLWQVTIGDRIGQTTAPEPPKIGA